MSLQSLLYVGIGGFLGANARHILATVITNMLVGKTGWPVPFGTAFVNTTGSLLLAIFSVWASREAGVPNNISLLIGTGFFGAYTTFSTFANESILLVNGDMPLAGWLYIISTNLLCLLGVVIGFWLAHRIWPT